MATLIIPDFKKDEDAGSTPAPENITTADEAAIQGDIDAVVSEPAQDDVVSQTTTLKLPEQSKEQLDAVAGKRKGRKT